MEKSVDFMLTFCCACDVYRCAKIQQRDTKEQTEAVDEQQTMEK